MAREKFVMSFAVFFKISSYCTGSRRRGREEGDGGRKRMEGGRRWREEGDGGRRKKGKKRERGWEDMDGVGLRVGEGKEEDRGEEGERKRKEKRGGNTEKE